MAALPFALIGGIWLLYVLDYNMSVAAAVGFIALAGVAAEFGVIMLLYLKQRGRRASPPARPARPICSTLSATARCCAYGRRR